MRIIAFVLVVLLAGCASSPPTRFYTLDPIAPGSPQVSPRELTVQVAEVRIPPMLDREEMVRESAPETLDLSDTNRWGAPLGQMVQRVLSQDLATRLPGSTIVGPGEMPPAGARLIVVNLLRFGAGPDGQVVLAGSWTLLSAGNGRSIASHAVNLVSQTLTGNYHDQAAAMSRLLGRLADQIAAALAH